MKEENRKIIEMSIEIERLIKQKYPNCTFDWIRDVLWISIYKQYVLEEKQGRRTVEGTTKHFVNRANQEIRSMRMREWR